MSTNIPKLLLFTHEMIENKDLAAFNRGIKTYPIISEYIQVLYSNDQKNIRPLSLAEITVKHRVILHKAIYYGLDNLTAYLIENRYNIDSRERIKLKTPLHYAVYNKKITIVRDLLDAGAHIDAQNNNGNTPLHEAVRYANLEAVKFLCGRGAKNRIRNEEGYTPCSLASKIFRKKPTEKHKLIAFYLQHDYENRLCPSNPVSSSSEKLNNIE